MNTIYATHHVPIVPFVGAGKKKKQRGKGLVDNLSKAAKFLKDTQLISNTMSLFPNEKAQVIGNIAKQIGLGKKKKARKPKKQHGSGFFSDLGGGIGQATFGGLSGMGNMLHGGLSGLFGGGRKGKKKMINM